MINVAIRDLEERFAGRDSQQIESRMVRIATIIHLIVLIWTFVWFAPLLLTLGWTLMFGAFPFQTPLLILGMSVALFWLTNLAKIYSQDDQDSGYALSPDEKLLYPLIRETTHHFFETDLGNVWTTNHFGAEARTRHPCRQLFWPLHELRLGIFPLLVCHKRELQSIVAHECSHFVNAERRKERWCNSALAISWNGQYRPIFSPLGTGLRRLHREIWACNELLMRRDEIEADQNAANTMGAEATATALVKLYLFKHLYQDSGPLWNSSLLIQQATPPENMVDLYQSFIADVLNEPERIERTYETLMQSRTSPIHPHPALVDRISNLGFDKDHFQQLAMKALSGISSESVPSIPNESHLLWAELKSNLNRYFCAEATAEWKLRHQTIQTIDKGTQPKTPSREDLRNQAYFYKLTHQKHERIEALEVTVRRFPDEILPKTELAALKLSVHGDESGLDTLWSGLDCPSIEAGHVAYQSLTQHFELTGDEKQLFEIAKFAEPLSRREMRLAVEKGHRPLACPLHPSKLAPAIINALENEFSNFPTIERVFAGRRPLQACSSTQQFLLFVHPARFTFQSTKRLHAIAKSINFVPFEFRVFYHRTFSRTCRQVTRLPNAMIYCRSQAAR